MTNLNNITKFIKKNYIYVNISLLILIIYVILFPIISIPLNTAFPQFSICPYLRITGRPCPLCGGTRYIAGLYKVFSDITYLFNPFGIMMLIIVCDGIFRIYNIVTRKKEKDTKYVDRDINIHVFLLNIFNIYEIVYIINQLMTM